MKCADETQTDPNNLLFRMRCASIPKPPSFLAPDASIVMGFMDGFTKSVFAVERDEEPDGSVVYGCRYRVFDLNRLPTTMLGFRDGDAFIPILGVE